MILKKYQQKRSFSQTPEPKGASPTSHPNVFCVQMHDASHLHYDFRLEHKGVLLSWAVPKGPSMNPSDKRLAIQVEDHPFEYRNFEGIIPPGNYGAGTVMIWDEGSYSVQDAGNQKELEAAMEKGLKKGHIEIILSGDKLQGAFNLVKMKNSDNNWLLIKEKDQFAVSIDILAKDHSVRSKRSLDDIASKVSFKKNKASKQSLPEFTSPMLATLTDSAFDNSDWLFEVKWDGYRTLAYIDNKVVLYSRNKNLFNSTFPSIAKELAKIKINCILDGEVVIVDEKGRSDFQLMQNYQATQKGNLCYYVFDLLFINGEDIRDLPLEERKERLKTLLAAYPLKTVLFSDHIEKKGIPFFEKAQEFNLEGIIAKKKSSIYRSARSKEWLKIKTHYRQEAVIIGFTEPRNSRKHFGALLLGVYENNKLIYIGHVGTGFTQALLKALYEKMLPLAVDKCPLVKPVKPNMPVTWIKPKLVCEIVFSEWTDSGIMRQPTFKGLRIDKVAKQVKREVSI